MVSFLAALLGQSIEDHLSAGDGPFGSGDDWFFYPTRLSESILITRDVLGQWRILHAVRDAFAICGWLLLVLLKFSAGRKKVCGDVECGFRN